ncbi:MAG: glycosyltransferase family 4 protein [Thermoanaerobaculia bacterium]|nr:glycosyltransferase family 4 protein [Thermoanaerobaculia bacterium]
MKIAVVEPIGKGGMIHYAWQLCRAMHELGAAITLVTDRHYELHDLPHPFDLDRSLRLWDPKPEREVESRMLRRVRRSGRALIYYREWLRLMTIVRRMRPDVVQFGDLRFATDLFPLLAIRRIAPIMADICHNVHPFSGGAVSSGSFGASRLEASLYSRSYRQFDTVFVHYDSSVREFARTFPESASRAVRIVHGNEGIFDDLAAADVSEGTLRERLVLSDSASVVLFFGTLSRYKGLDLLLDAFERVAAAAENAVLVLAGYAFSDFDPDDYRAEARERGLAERVHVVDRYIPAEEVRGWMKLAAAAVFPYRSIYQSGALQLAHTFGAPIVATRVGAMSEVIRNEETGLLVQPESRDELAEAIIRLLQDRVLARRLGENAEREARTRFSWSRVAGTILETYEKLQRRKAS